MLARWTTVISTSVFLLAASLDAQAEKGVCEKKHLSRHYTKSSLPLRVRDPRVPEFYLRMRTSLTLVYLLPDDVVDALGEFANLPSAARLQDLIRHDLPLKEDTDLFKYVTRDNDALGDVERALDVVLKQGKAAIDGWPCGAGILAPHYLPKDPMTVTVISFGDEAQEDGRWYCFPEHQLLFGQWYVIY